jgi:Na+/H+ antiporter NhaC
VSLEPDTIGGVLCWILRHPWRAVGRRWNYKAALLSAAVRGTLFFGANLSAGLPAATAAFTTELSFRFAASGFFGAVTQAFRRAKPERTALITVVILLPAITHSLELVVHWLRGTPELLVSISASIVFTAISTAFNLFAMQRGALLVGAGQRSLVADLRLMPKLVWLFLTGWARPCRLRAD